MRYGKLNNEYTEETPGDDDDEEDDCQSTIFNDIAQFYCLSILCAAEIAHEYLISIYHVSLSLDPFRPIFFPDKGCWL